MTPADYRRAERLLARRDPVLRSFIRTIGPCGMARSQREDPFVAMLEAIVWQQLSTKAAAAIYSRVLAALPDGGPPTPANVAAADSLALRAAGLSRAKVAYIQDLATKVRDGVVHLDRLHLLDDEAVIEELTKVKGIGRWTAEMFCIFTLRRLDVWPVGDLGVRAGYARAYGWAELPTPQALQAEGERFRPYRTLAAWYCWRVVVAAVPAARPVRRERTASGPTPTADRRR
jgi:DNA-3-methyladenine glycosylase II